MNDQPAIQLIANLVVDDGSGHVLFTHLDPEDDRWWLPGDDLQPYEHPDAAAARVLGEWPELRVERVELAKIESFRGRRGWHVVFHYHVRATGVPGDSRDAAWHRADAPPATVHGRWERDIVESVLAWSDGQRASS
jgi:ADP-ribose pyrophosphatase YjhB (NUDIX family)